MAQTKKKSTSTKKKTSSKKLEREIKKAAKKNPVAAFVILILIILLIGSGYYCYSKKISPIYDWINNVITIDNKNEFESITYTGVTYEDFQIHFMMLGNEKAGDSVYIKAGETDVLIDAGSNYGSSKTTLSYMNQYVTDSKLEYVIATHGDLDHVAEFPTILKTYSAGTIIYNEYTAKTTTAYSNMISAFNTQKAKGANVYYAADCWNNANGAKRVYQLSDKVTMTILYNKYYFEKGYTSKDAPSGWENNYSVCTLFTYKNGDETKNFLLTGDLEEAGEEAMAAFYDGSTAEKTLPEVDVFKAGHHGSKTSSNDCLLSIIKPKMCVVSCCCGTDEYTGNTANQFPTQAFIDRIAKYTDAVYITSIYNTYTIKTAETDKEQAGVKTGGQYIHTTGYKAMNGHILVSCGINTETNKADIGLSCSNNTTKLKDSDWMKLKVTIDGKEISVRTMPETWK